MHEGESAMSEERYVSIAEVKELLNNENERRKTLIPADQPAVVYKPVADGEEQPVEEVDDSVLNQVQKDAKAHAEATSKLTKAEADKLIESLNEIECCKGEVAYKIADILPKYPGDVNVIFSKERTKPEPSDVTKILDIVKKYC